MAASLFSNKSAKPDDTILSAALGKTQKHLDKICSFIKDVAGSVTPEWKFYGQKSGWVLKLLSGKRNLLFVVPGQGCFRVAFTFGDRAVHEIMAGDLPGYIQQELAAAKKYAEGRTIQLDVKTGTQCEHVLELIRVKLLT